METKDTLQPHDNDDGSSSSSSSSNSQQERSKTTQSAAAVGSFRTPSQQQQQQQHQPLATIAAAARSGESNPNRMMNTNEAATTATTEDKDSENDSSVGVNQSFPGILHTVLELAEKEGYSDIIAWQPHGRAFLVRDKDRFVEKIMPLYFRQSVFASFQRQLNLYGFSRVYSRGPDYGAFYHDKFLRGAGHLTALILRKGAKKGGKSAKRGGVYPRNTPDFYSMPPMPPTPTSSVVPSRITTRTSEPSGGGTSMAMDTTNIHSFETEHQEGGSKPSATTTRSVPTTFTHPNDSFLSLAESECLRREKIGVALLSSTTEGSAIRSTAKNEKGMANSMPSSSSQQQGEDRQSFVRFLGSTSSLDPTAMSGSRISDGTIPSQNHQPFGMYDARTTAPQRQQFSSDSSNRTFRPLPFSSSAAAVVEGFSTNFDSNGRRPFSTQHVGTNGHFGTQQQQQQGQNLDAMTREVQHGSSSSSPRESLGDLFHDSFAPSQSSFPPGNSSVAPAHLPLPPRPAQHSYSHLLLDYHHNFHCFHSPFLDHLGGNEARLPAWRQQQQQQQQQSNVFDGQIFTRSESSLSQSESQIRHSSNQHLIASPASEGAATWPGSRGMNILTQGQYFGEQARTESVTAPPVPHVRFERPATRTPPSTVINALTLDNATSTTSSVSEYNRRYRPAGNNSQPFSRLDDRGDELRQYQNQLQREHDQHNGLDSFDRAIGAIADVDEHHTLLPQLFSVDSNSFLFDGAAQSNFFTHYPAPQPPPNAPHEQDQRQTDRNDQR